MFGSRTLPRLAETSWDSSPRETPWFESPDPSPRTDLSSATTLRPKIFSRGAWGVSVSRSEETEVFYLKKETFLTYSCYDLNPCGSYHLSLFLIPRQTYELTHGKTGKGPERSLRGYGGWNRSSNVPNFSGSPLTSMTIASVELFFQPNTGLLDILRVTSCLTGQCRVRGV